MSHTVPCCYARCTELYTRTCLQCLSITRTVISRTFNSWFSVLPSLPQWCEPADYLTMDCLINKCFYGKNRRWWWWWWCVCVCVCVCVRAMLLLFVSLLYTPWAVKLLKGRAPLLLLSLKMSIYIGIYTQNPCLPAPFLPGKTWGNPHVHHHTLIMAAKDQKISWSQDLQNSFRCMNLKTLLHY